ncbi:MAG: tetratricopeptide repeat protein [Candidatus Omnitrophota bacterium]
MKRFLWLILVVFVFAGCGSQETKTEKASGLEGQKKAPSGQATALVRQGMKNLNEGDVAGAIKAFHAAIVKDPKDSRGYLFLSQTYLRLKEYPRAIEVLTALLFIEPNNGEVNYLLGLAYGLNGDKEAAKKYVQRSVEIFQDNRDKENFLKSLSLLQSLFDK